MFVELGEEIRQASCGDQHTLVLTESGRLFSTGKAEHGRLGRGDIQDEPEFEEIEFFLHSNDSILNPAEETEVCKIDSGSNFSAAMSTHGEIWLWGRNDYGQMGHGVEEAHGPDAASLYPRLIRTLPLEGNRVTDFACGRHHVVALTSAGAIYEWGNRGFFEPHPITLPGRYSAGIPGLVRVFAGENASFALTADGLLYSWGRASSGCLAQGTGCDDLAKPKLVDPALFGGGRVVDFAVGHGRCLAITSP